MGFYEVQTAGVNATCRLRRHRRRRHRSHTHSREPIQLGEFGRHSAYMQQHTENRFKIFQCVGGMRESVSSRDAGRLRGGTVALEQPDGSSTIECRGEREAGGWPTGPSCLLALDQELVESF